MKEVILTGVITLLIFGILCNFNIDIKDKNTQILLVIGISIIIYVVLHHIPNKEGFSPYKKEKSLIVMANEANRILTSEESGGDFETNLLSQDYLDSIVNDQQNYLKYGDVVYLQSNALNNKFLTGGRGGNIINITSTITNNQNSSDIDIDDIEEPIEKYTVMKFLPINKFLKLVNSSNLLMSSYVDLDNIIEIIDIGDNQKNIKFTKFNKFLSMDISGNIGYVSNLTENCKFIFTKRSNGYLIRAHNSFRHLTITNNQLSSINIDSQSDQNLDDILFDFVKLFFNKLNLVDNVVIKPKINSFIGIRNNSVILEKQISSSDCKFDIISKGNHIFYIKNINTNKYVSLNSANNVVLLGDADTYNEFYIIRQMNSRFLIKSVLSNMFLVLLTNGNLGTTDTVTNKCFFYISEALNKKDTILDTQDTTLNTQHDDKKNLNQQVFTTNGEGNKFQWIVRSTHGTGMLNYPDPLHGKFVKYNSKVYLQSATRKNIYLSSGLPGSYSTIGLQTYDVIGVFPKEYDDHEYQDNNKINMEWSLRKNNNNQNVDLGNDEGYVLYNYPIAIQALNISNKFLTGSIGKQINNEANEEAYVLGNELGTIEQQWIIKKEKGNGSIMRIVKQWPLSKYVSGKIGSLFWKNKFMASSCRGYSPYVNNIKMGEGTNSSDQKFGEPCNGVNDKYDYISRDSTASEDEPIGIDAGWKVLTTERGWSTKNLRCLSDDNTHDFLNIDLGDETIVKRGRLYSTNDGYIKKFNLKIAGNDGIFIEIGEYITTLNFPWLVNNNMVFIEDGYSKIFKNDTVAQESCTSLDWPSPNNNFCSTSYRNLGPNQSNLCYNNNNNSYDSAKNKCASMGSRLCNIDELRDFSNEINNADNETCNLNNKYVWSSQNCTLSDGGIGYKAIRNNSGVVDDKCKNKNTLLNIRCCSNTNGKVINIISSADKPNNNILPESRIAERFIIKMNSFDKSKISIKSALNDNYICALDDYENVSLKPMTDISNNEHILNVIPIDGTNRVALQTYLNTFLSIQDLYQGSTRKSLKQINKSNITPEDIRESFIIHNIETNLNNTTFEFNINKKLRFLKITPMDSYGLCSMKLELFKNNSNLDILKQMRRNRNINVKASSCFKYLNGSVSTDSKNGQYCKYGGFTTDEINRFGNGGWMMSNRDNQGSAFIIFDNLKEGYINGGIIYSRDDYLDDSCSSCNNYVKKFSVHVAGNNKIFRKISEHETNFDSNKGKDIGFKFDISKENVRYVKLLLLECNNKCSMRLDIF